MMWNPHGPYPILIIEGEQGSAKTTTARALRSLIDPATSAVRTIPRNEHDLAIAAGNGWVVAYDNLSGMPVWLSDALCRLSTGGGFSTRTLFTNDEESIFDSKRPIILTGIDQIASRHDLLDRAIIAKLPVISEEHRRPETEFWAEFEQARPQILGALLDTVSAGLRNIPTTKLDRLPRMADFALWVTASEEALPWEPGAFLQAYASNRAEAVDIALEADLVATALRQFMESRYEWTGTASELLEQLSGLTSEKLQKTDAWPKKPNALGMRLTRCAAFLRAAGIDIKSNPKTRPRTYAIRKGVQKAVGAVGADEPASAASPEADSFFGEAGGERKAVGKAGGAQPSWNNVFANPDSSDSFLQQLSNNEAKVKCTHCHRLADKTCSAGHQIDGIFLLRDCRDFARAGGGQ
jgi:hypothetical protein